MSSMRLACRATSSITPVKSACGQSRMVTAGTMAPFSVASVSWSSVEVPSATARRSNPSMVTNFPASIRCAPSRVRTSLPCRTDRISSPASSRGFNRRTTSPSRGSPTPVARRSPVTRRSSSRTISASDVSSGLAARMRDSAVIMVPPDPTRTDLGQGSNRRPGSAVGGPASAGEQAVAHQKAIQKVRPKMAESFFHRGMCRPGSGWVCG